MSSLILLAFAFAYTAVVTCDPYWRLQVGRGMSRLLNAMCGGEGDCTFSAWSHELVVRKNWWGTIRVAVVDHLPWNGAGHCERAWEWHREHGLLWDDREAA